MHVRETLEHLQLTATYFVLHPQIISCIHTSGIAGKRFQTTSILPSNGFRWFIFYIHYCSVPGRVAQSVTCLATDACLTAVPGVASSIPARSHTFAEIDHEIISTVILLPSAESFKKGCCQLQMKVCARSTG